MNLGLSLGIVPSLWILIILPGCLLGSCAISPLPLSPIEAYKKSSFKTILDPKWKPDWIAGSALNMFLNSKKLLLYVAIAIDVLLLLFLSFSEYETYRISFLYKTSRGHLATEPHYGDYFSVLNYLF